MKGITVFETLTDIRDDYIRDAELDAPLVTAPTRKREKSPSTFGRFINSGWGVAVICALVAVSVMGGIIWAGFNAGDLPPGYQDSVTGEVYLTAGGQTVTPEAFFGYSEVQKGNQHAISCGSGFYGVFTVSPVPTLTYGDDLRLHMPSGYILEGVYVYPTYGSSEIPAADSAETNSETPLETLYMYAFESVDDLATLPTGDYHVALRVSYREGKNKYGYDYAFCLIVTPEVELPIMKQPYEWPVFDPPASAFLGGNTGTYPDGGSVVNIPLTAAYTQVRTPKGMAWYVMTVRYAKGAGDGGLIFLLYDPQSASDAPYIALDRQLQFIYPPVRALLQLEDGRIITLHGEGDILKGQESLEITANVWMWSKVDPDTGEELEEIQLVPQGEAWSYTFDLTDPSVAMKGWEYAFASYIYGLTDGEPPTLRVLLDNLFCETNEIKYDLAQFEHFSEEENPTTGWARLQRIMNGELRPDLWIKNGEPLDLICGDVGLGNRLYVNFDPDGSLWVLIGRYDDIQEIYRGTYVLRDGLITIDCPIGSNYFGISIHGTHTFEQSGAGIRIGDCGLTIMDRDVAFPAVYIPIILDFFRDLNASADEYRQVRPESYAVLDMDGDGTEEIVVESAWDGVVSYDESYVFFIDPAAGKLVDHVKISYSHLYEDGSFAYTFDRTGPSYGVDKLVSTEEGYQSQTLWRICNDGSEDAAYYVGDRAVTWEEWKAYVHEIECDEVIRTACAWEITELATDAYADVPEDGKGASVEFPSGGKG